MRAVRFHTSTGATRIGRWEGDEVIDAGPANPAGFVPSAAAWSQLGGADGERYRAAEVTLLAPVVPSSVICVGLNYRDHAAESGLQLPSAPLLFAKLASCLIGPGDDIVLPEGEEYPDFEAEVAVVIGSSARDGNEGLRAVGGYTAFNDVTGRQAQSVDGQWTRGKSFDTFGPIGPCITSPDEIADPDGIELSCELSGKLMQDSSTAQLIFNIPALINYISKQITLRPGDVIATGTPAGIGYAREPKVRLQEGDVLVTRVAGVGELRNRVVGARPTA